MLFSSYEYRNAFSPEPTAVVRNEFMDYSSSSGSSSSGDGNFNKSTSSRSCGSNRGSSNNCKHKAGADSNRGPRRRHCGARMAPTLFKQKREEMKAEGAAHAGAHTDAVCTARCLCSQGDDLDGEDDERGESQCGLIEETKQDVFSPRVRRGCSRRSMVASKSKY